MYGGAKYPRIFSRGYNILGGTQYPVTLDNGLVGHGSLPSARLKYCNRDIRARNDVKVRNKTLFAKR